MIASKASGFQYYLILGFCGSGSSRPCILNEVTCPWLTVNIFIFVVNVYAPVLHTTSSVFVAIGGSQVLNTSVLSVYDADTPSVNLLLHVVNPPDNGKLVRKHEGKEIHLRKGDTFTVPELKKHSIHFIHDKDKSRLVTLQKLLHSLSSGSLTYRHWEFLTWMPPTDNQTL